MKIYKSDIMFALTIIFALLTVLSGFYSGQLSLFFGTLTFASTLALGAFENED